MKDYVAAAQTLDSLSELAMAVMAKVARVYNFQQVSFSKLVLVLDIAC